MRSKAEMATVLAALQTAFGTSWNGDANQTATPLFGFGPQSDLNNVSSVIGGIDQGGLGPPNRDFYLNESEPMSATRMSYTTELSSLLTLDGMKPADAAADAATVLRLETALAHAQMDNITRRDPAKANNRYTLAQLKKLMPGSTSMPTLRHWALRPHRSMRSPRPTSSGR